MPLCQGGDPGAIPGSRTIYHIATHPHTRRWLDKQGAGLQNQFMQARYLPAVRGAAMFSLFHVGPWLDKEGTCLASRLMREYYPPAPPTFY